MSENGEHGLKEVRYHVAMLFDDDVCYRALAAHDARFDGMFFVGVSTTGIYCRPVCPARTPRRDRCAFFSNAAAAERAGYRPCLRCRPEAAPGRAGVDAVEMWATHALRRIEDGALMDMSLSDLAQELGISDRHLRRTVKRLFGVSPIELAQTQRLLTAKRLLVDTALPVGEVAIASGFDSLRRFNSLFKARYGLVPTSLRRSRTDIRADVSCEVGSRPPFDWASMLSFLAPRASGGVELAVEGCYRRTVELRNRTGWISVAPSAGKSSLRVVISSSLARAVPEVLVRVKRLFDLTADPAEIAARVGPLGEAHPGLRVPGAFDGFEVAVRAIIGQQVSVRGASVIAGRFTEAFGEPLATPWPELSRLTPTAARIAPLSVSDVASVGIIRSRARAILALAEAVTSKNVVLAPGADVQKTTQALRALPGVGEWTAEYIAMRCLSWPDAFPRTDLALRKALRGWADFPTDEWRPWRAYAAMHLWKSLETRQ